MTRWNRLCALLCAGLLLTGCAGDAPDDLRPAHDPVSGHGAGPADGLPAAPEIAPVAGLSELPAVAELAGALAPAPRGASYLPSDLFMQGEAFDAALPHQRVTATAGGAAFDPNWRRASADAADLAYAMYAFNVKGYGGNARFYTSWATTPPDWGDVYLALANWDEVRWDWFSFATNGTAPLSALAPYIDFGGNLLACVLLIDTNPAELDWLRLGSLPPQPALTASLDAGLTPLTVDFDASGSSDGDSSIVDYRWDPQGDGSFEVSTGTDPHYTHEYTTEGDYQVTLRVVDNHGVYADVAVTVSALDDVYFSFGTSEEEDRGMNVFSCSDGDLLVFINSFNDDPVGWKIVQAKLSLTGEARFIRTWSDSGRVDLFDAVADAEGNYYVCGEDTAYGSYDGLLQKWNQNGELVWSKAVGTDNDAEVFNALCLAGDSLYVCGDWYSYDLLRHFGILLRFDLSGNKVWDYSLIGPVDCTLNDIAYHATEQVGTPSLYVCGEFNPSFSDTDAFFATFDTDGNLYSGKRWGDAGSSRETATAISVRGILSPAVYIAGSIVNPGTRSFITQPGVTTILLSGGTHLETADLLDLTVLARHVDTDTPPGLSLVTFDSSLTLLTQREFSAAGASYAPADLATYDASAFVVTGTQFGGLPAEVPLTLTTEASALAWTDAAVPVGNPSFTVLDTPTALEDHPGFELNGQAYDGDAFVLLEKW